MASLSSLIPSNTLSSSSAPVGHNVPSPTKKPTKKSRTELSQLESSTAGIATLTLSPPEQWIRRTKEAHRRAKDSHTIVVENIAKMEAELAILKKEKIDLLTGPLNIELNRIVTAIETQNVALQKLQRQFETLQKTHADDIAASSNNPADIIPKIENHIKLLLPLKSSQQELNNRKSELEFERVKVLDKIREAEHNESGLDGKIIELATKIENLLKEKENYWNQIQFFQPIVDCSSHSVEFTLHVINPRENLERKSNEKDEKEGKESPSSRSTPSIPRRATSSNSSSSTSSPSSIRTTRTESFSSGSSLSLEISSPTSSSSSTFPLSKKRKDAPKDIASVDLVLAELAGDVAIIPEMPNVEDFQDHPLHRKIILKENIDPLLSQITQQPDFLSILDTPVHGWAVIQLAVMYGSPKIVETLLTHRPNLNVVKNGWNFIQLIALSKAMNQAGIEKLLSKLKGCFTVPYPKEISPLHLACYHGNERTLKGVLKYIKNHDERISTTGHRPLHMAVFSSIRGRTLVLKEFLKSAKFRINETDGFLRSAIFYACDFACLSAVTDLLGCNLKLNLRLNDKDGRNSISYAQEPSAMVGSSPQNSEERMKVINYLKHFYAETVTHWEGSYYS